MDVPLPQRVPDNAPGDFYVEAGLCTRCCLVHGEAPDLLNDRDQPFEECFFRRQPRTPAEIDQAIGAISVSEMGALRYGGNDANIIAKLRARRCARACDHTPEGIAWRTPRPQPAIDYRAPQPAPIPSRPGLRALTSAAFAGALYFSFFTFVIARKFQLPLARTWTLYAAIALALLGVLFFRLAYRRPTGGG